jgi:TonB-linked SusC/RagA family outer membrane protein
MKNTIQWKKPIRLIIFFLLFPCWAFAQSITISGTIKDPTGETLVGVNVIETGTTRGTISDIDGNYQISVSPDAKLTFSYIGFESQTVDVRGRTSINITMKEDINTLEEVVVVGYGTMRKSDLTGAVSSVRTDAIQKSVPTSIDQVLQGRAAGVQIQQSSGMPGAGSNIRIRGTSSLNSSNEPIYVIDGVIISQDVNNMNSNVMASINPSDIVSIDILKDASATAIYGSRASNGVIIVTTRRGEAGSAVINFSTNIGWQQVPKHLDMLNLREYAEHRNVLSDKVGLRPNSNFVRPDLLGAGTDWQNEMFRTALMQTYNLSVSGGTKTTTYNLSGGYLNQDGIAIGSGFKRYNLTGNFDSDVKEWAKVGVNMAFSNTFQDLTFDDNSLIVNALRSTPDLPVKNVDGSFSASEEDFMPQNPIADIELKDNTRESFGIRGNTYIELKPVGLLYNNAKKEGLKYRFELALDYNMAKQDQFTPTYYLSRTQFNEIAQATNSKNYGKYWTYRNLLTYNKKINIHTIDVMLGQEYQTSRWENLSSSASDFPSNSAHDLTLGKPTGGNGQSGQNALSSQFGRIFYGLQDIYMLTATLRHDGTSTFAPENRWGWFPSAAFAWRISGYDYFQQDNISNLLSNLKLRFGWGLVGNQQINTQSGWFATYRTNVTAWKPGLIPANSPNPDLKWESTTSTNIGLDLGLFKNRIEVVFDWYNRKTDDLLLEVPLPSYAGVSTMNTQGGSRTKVANVGALQNRGIEITVNTQNIITKDFQWNSNFIFSMNRNEVLNLSTGEMLSHHTSDNIYGEGRTLTGRTIVGQPIGQIYGYKVIGRFEKASDFYMYNDAGEIVRTPVTIDSQGNMMAIGENSIWIGDYIYEDVNKDGVITEADQVVIGNPEAKFTYSVGNTLSYKGWDLSVTLSGSYGNDVANYSRRFLSNPFRNTSNLYTEALDYARVDLINPDLPNDYRNVQIVGGNPKHPRMALNGVTSEYNFQFSDRFIEDGSFLRLQNISLAYSFPRVWIQKIGVSACKLSLNMQNVYTWTKYKGYDPEIGFDAFGIDNGRYPSPRQYTFGLNLTL